MNDVLPTVTELPLADVVLWDGNCSFCRGQISRLHRLDGGKLAYLSLHDPRATELAGELTHEQMMDQMWLLTRDGKQFGGADAIRILSRKLPRLWLLALPMNFPFTMPIWRSLYRMVANRRYRISAQNCDEDGTCKLHGPQPPDDV